MTKDKVIKTTNGADSWTLYSDDFTIVQNDMLLIDNNVHVCGNDGLLSGFDEKHEYSIFDLATSSDGTKQVAVGENVVYSFEEDDTSYPTWVYYLDSEGISFDKTFKSVSFSDAATLFVLLKMDLSQNSPTSMKNVFNIIVIVALGSSAFAQQFSYHTSPDFIKIHGEFPEQTTSGSYSAGSTYYVSFPNYQLTTIDGGFLNFQVVGSFDYSPLRWMIRWEWALAQIWGLDISYQLDSMV